VETCAIFGKSKMVTSEKSSFVGGERGGQRSMKRENVFVKNDIT